MATLRAAIDSSGATVGARVFVVAVEQMRRAVLGMQAQSATMSATMATLSSQLSGVAALTASYFAAFQGITLIKEAIGSLSTFDQKLRELAAIGGVGIDTKPFQELKDIAIGLAGETRFSVNEVLEGLTELTKAGQTTSEAMSSIRSVLDLAVIGNMDLSRAVDVVVSSLAQFNLGADEASRVVDVLAKAANETITDVSELGEALRVIGPIAKNLGIPFEDIVAILGVVAQAGTKASLSGTQLRSVFASLATPTDEAAAKLKQFGIDTEKLGELFEKGGEEVFLRLQKNTLGAADAFEVFDNRGATVALSASSAADGIVRLNQVLLEAKGTGRATADAVGKGLQDGFQKAANAADTLFKKMSDDAGLIEGMRSFAASTSEMLNKVNQSGPTIAALSSSFSFLATSLAAVTSIRLAAWAIEAAKQLFVLRTATTALTATTGVTTQVTAFGAAIARLRSAFVTAPILSWATAIGIAGAAIFAFGDDLVSTEQNLERFHKSMMSFEDISQQIARSQVNFKDASITDDRSKQVEAFDQQIKVYEEAILRGRTALQQLEVGSITVPPVISIEDAKGLLDTSSIDRVVNSTRTQLVELLRKAYKFETSEEDIRAEFDRITTVFKQEAKEFAGVQIEATDIENIWGNSFDQVFPKQSRPWDFIFEGTLTPKETDLSKLKNDFQDLAQLFGKDAQEIIDRNVGNLEVQVGKLEPVAIPLDQRSITELETTLQRIKVQRQELLDKPIPQTDVVDTKPPSELFEEEIRRIRAEQISTNVDLTDTYAAQRMELQAQTVAYMDLNESRVENEKLSREEADRLDDEMARLQRLRAELINVQEAKEDQKNTQTFTAESRRIEISTLQSESTTVTGSTKFDRQRQILEKTNEAYLESIELQKKDGTLTEERASKLIALNQQLYESEQAVIALNEAQEQRSKSIQFEDDELKLVSQLLQARAAYTDTLEDHVAVIQQEQLVQKLAIDRAVETKELTESEAANRRRVVDEITSQQIALAQLNDERKREQESYESFVQNNKLLLNVGKDVVGDFAQAIGAAAAGFGTLQEIGQRAIQNLIANLVSATAEAILLNSVLKPILTGGFGLDAGMVDKFFGGTNANGNVFQQTYANGAAFTQSNNSSSIQAYAQGDAFTRAYAAGDTFTQTIRAYAAGDIFDSQNSEYRNGSAFDSRTAAYANGGTFIRAYAAGDVFDSDVAAFKDGDTFHSRVSAYANGASFTATQNSSKVQAYAGGSNPFTNSIVNQPTYFNLGLMGEAGPEAIAPLTQSKEGLSFYGFVSGQFSGTLPVVRGSNGKIGVDISKFREMERSRDVESFRERETREFARGGVFNYSDSLISSSYASSSGIGDSIMDEPKIPENIIRSSPGATFEGDDISSASTGPVDKSRNTTVYDQRSFTTTINVKPSPHDRTRGARKTGRQFEQEIRSQSR